MKTPKINNETDLVHKKKARSVTCWIDLPARGRPEIASPTSSPLLDKVKV
jgi:hypothetical protein